MSNDAEIPDGARLSRLQTRPSEGRKERVTTGERLISSGHGRDAILFIPSRYDPGSPVPLMVCLHGAGGQARHGIEALRAEAERACVALLAINSLRETWDLLVQGFGPDVEWIDQALNSVFSLLAVDATRIAIDGFSDGASYALSLGITNGDLFGYIFAFSPGFMDPAVWVGSPRIFITHGTSDKVLPVTCSRQIVAMLSQAEYQTRYQEFDGGHTVPVHFIREAMDLLAG